MGTQKPIAQRVWAVIQPPSGRDARRVVMTFTALVAAGRFGLTAVTSPGSASRINVIPSWQYGIAFLVLLLALIVTLGSRRVTMFGFVTSVLGCGIYTLQAVDVWPVLPSAAYYALMGLILMADGAVIWRTLHVHS